MFLLAPLYLFAIGLRRLFFLNLPLLRPLFFLKVLYILVFILLHVNSWDKIRIPPSLVDCKIFMSSLRLIPPCGFITASRPQRSLLQPIRFYSAHVRRSGDITYLVRSRSSFPLTTKKLKFAKTASYNKHLIWELMLTNGFFRIEREIRRGKKERKKNK
jgi:hypothetical protein